MREDQFAHMIRSPLRGHSGGRSWEGTAVGVYGGIGAVSCRGTAAWPGYARDSAAVKCGSNGHRLRGAIEVVDQATVLAG